ncbi:MAG: o-succinylbenzoate--CoA ligase, partial [candidate division Zixibacteria bacterium]|nr:o-succinylbenzoate--CoA ligase [candidate division Zixibacteria bacterium]
MTKVKCPLKMAADRWPNSTALVAPDINLNYRQFEQCVVSAVARLRKINVKQDDRVAVISDNRWEHVVLLWALWRLGVTSCVISPRYPSEMVISILRNTDCRIIICHTGMISKELPSSICVIGLETVVCLDDKTDNIFVDVEPINLDRDATIVLTSGTSAKPKAALHTFGNHYYNALGSNANITIASGDCWLLSLPLYHVGGLGVLFRTMLAGGAIVVPEIEKSVNIAIERHEITHLSLVPTQLRSMLDEPLCRKAQERLKAVLVGGSSIPSSLISRGYEKGLPLFMTYGLTEMTSQVTTTPPNSPVESLYTSGRTLKYREVSLDGHGEILVSGKTLFKGYIESDSVVLPLDTEGWFHTGDMGDFDKTGNLTVQGRRDNMFISGGENIHPEEIEQALCLLSDISEAVVVPCDDDQFGFRPVAFINTLDRQKIKNRDIVHHLEQ